MVPIDADSRLNVPGVLRAVEAGVDVRLEVGVDVRLEVDVRLFLPGVS